MGDKQTYNVSSFQGKQSSYIIICARKKK